MFKEYFGIVGKPYTFAGMNGGSDYYPFLQAGVPAGGLATGAGSLKTAAERTTFGGFANAAYDPCYHQPCDTTENISQTALELMADAAAFVIQKVAMADSLADVLSVAQ
jgi:Zn-dependent M28 family amino/carboxypeptidase